MVFELDMWLTSGKNIVSMVHHHCRLKSSSFGQLTFKTSLFYTIVRGFIMKWDGMFTLFVPFIYRSVKYLLLLISGMSVWLSLTKMSSIKFSFICNVRKLKSIYFGILFIKWTFSFSYFLSWICICSQINSILSAVSRLRLVSLDGAGSKSLDNGRHSIVGSCLNYVSVGYLYIISSEKKGINYILSVWNQKGGNSYTFTQSYTPLLAFNRWYVTINWLMPFFTFISYFQGCIKCVACKQDVM